LTQNNAVKKIIALPGPDGSPVFFSRRQTVSFRHFSCPPYFYYSNGHIAVVDLATVLAKPASTPPMSMT